MAGERVPLGLLEKPDAPLFQTPSGGGAGAGAGEEGLAVRAPAQHRVSDGGAPPASPRLGPFPGAATSSQDAVLHGRATRSVPASPIQPPSTASKGRRPAVDRALFSPTRLEEPRSVDVSSASLSLDEVEEDGGGGADDDEPLPPLRYAPPAPPELLDTECRALQLRWAEPEELSGAALTEGESSPTLVYVLEMQRVSLSLPGLLLPWLPRLPSPVSDDPGSDT